MNFSKIFINVLNFHKKKSNIFLPLNLLQSKQKRYFSKNLLKQFKSEDLFSERRVFVPSYIKQSNYSLKINTIEVDVTVPWGCIKVQVFGNPSANAKPIIALHGFLDNSNSFKPIAPYLAKDPYYIIAIDLPGHGFSSHIPRGIPYTLKLMLYSIRFVVKHFELKKFRFLAHSYGSLKSLMYAASFPDEVESIVMLDLALSDLKNNIKNMPKRWGSHMDEFIKLEEHIKAKHNLDDSIETNGRQLTREIALEKILKANNHLDEKSATILLERAIIVKDNKLEFSRDIRLKLATRTGDYHTDFLVIAENLHEHLRHPLLVAMVTPPSYGESSFKYSLEFFRNLRQNPKTSVQLLEINGTHHFHMINPEKIAQNIRNFYDENCLK